jgi:hypothetical protein
MMTNATAHLQRVCKPQGCIVVLLLKKTQRWCAFNTTNDGFANLTATSPAIFLVGEIWERQNVKTVHDCSYCKLVLERNLTTQAKAR